MDPGSVRLPPAASLIRTLDAWRRFRSIGIEIPFPRISIAAAINAPAVREVVSDEAETANPGSQWQLANIAVELRQLRVPSYRRNRPLRRAAAFIEAMNWIARKSEQPDSSSSSSSIEENSGPDDDVEDARRSDSGLECQPIGRDIHCPDHSLTRSITCNGSADSDVNEEDEESLSVLPMNEFAHQSLVDDLTCISDHTERRTGSEPLTDVSENHSQEENNDASGKKVQAYASIATAAALSSELIGDEGDSSGSSRTRVSDSGQELLQQLTQLSLAERVPDAALVDEAVDLVDDETDGQIDGAVAAGGEDEVVHRYPTRNRMPRLEFWRNQRPNYQRDSVTGCLKVVGIVQGFPSDQGKPKSAKKKKKKNSNSYRTNGSVSGRGKQDIQLLALLKDVTFICVPNSPDIEIAVTHKVGIFTRGLLKLKPLATKAEQQTVVMTTSFSVLRGAVEFKVKGKLPVTLMAGGSVTLPIRTCYAIDNLRSDEAILSFNLIRSGN